MCVSAPGFVHSTTKRDPLPVAGVFKIVSRPFLCVCIRVYEGALVLQRAVAVREQLVGISPLLPPSFGIELGSSDPVVSAFTCSAIVPVLVLHF